jgi:sugar O-acyltransferase (sialic acid O-acetyltransferase NeuD family)
VKSLVIIGAGGLGKEIAWSYGRSMGQSGEFNLVGYCDDNPALVGQTQLGLPVLSLEALLKDPHTDGMHFICAIGNNAVRKTLVDRCLSSQWQPLSIIDPSVILGLETQIGVGTYLAPGCIISNQTVLKDHIIVNLHASVGHDCRVEMFAQLCPGARISGNCIIETGAFLGTNAALAPGRHMGHNSILGGGSFCAVDIPDSTTALGTPARLVPVKPA